MRTKKVRSKFGFERFERFEVKMTHSFDIVCVVCFTVSSLLKGLKGISKCFGELRFRDVLKKRNLEHSSFVLNYSLIKIKFQLSLGSRHGSPASDKNVPISTPINSKTEIVPVSFVRFGTPGKILSLVLRLRCPLITRELQVLK